MKFKCTRFVALGLLATVLAADVRAQADHKTSTSLTAGEKLLTVAFWNIQWFPGRRPNASQREEIRQVEAVHRDIVELNADIIGMEEVRDFHRASLAIKPLPKFKVDVCSNFPPREGQLEAQQVAIASRLEPISAWFEMWRPGGPLVPPRGFAFAAYQIAPAEVLLVYALHLKSNRGELQENVAMREESIRQLLAHMKAMAGAYRKLGTISWIIGGDFNTAFDDKRFGMEKSLQNLISSGFQWSWTNVPAEQRVTLPPAERYPAACFDHVFYRGLGLRRAWTANSSPRSSDHRPVQATFYFLSPR